MSQLRVIKKRIILVRKTQKITKAMKMIAGIKFRKVELLLKKTLPYFLNSQMIGKDLSGSLFENSQPFFRKTKMDSEKDLMFVFTSDKGLCGNYNSAIIAKVKNMLQEKSKKYDVIFIGQKGFKGLKNFVDPLKTFSHSGLNIDHFVLEEMRNKILEHYHTYNRVWIIFMKSSGREGSSVHVKQLLPITEKDPKGSSPLFFYEKDESTVLSEFLKEYLWAMLKWAWMESVLSEENSRMIAMDSATNNGQEMLRSLSLLYNRLRQAHITREIIEIISGADALAS